MNLYELLLLLLFKGYEFMNGLPFIQFAFCDIIAFRDDARDFPRKLVR